MLRGEPVAHWESSGTGFQSLPRSTSIGQVTAPVSWLPGLHHSKPGGSVEAGETLPDRLNVTGASPIMSGRARKAGRVRSMIQERFSNVQVFVGHEPPEARPRFTAVVRTGCGPVACEAVVDRVVRALRPA